MAKAFEAAFDEKKIDAFGLDPNNFMKTALIDVELVRQEMLPNGRFGNETIIQPLRNNPLRPPFPGKAAKDHQILEYLNWATANPQELVAPVFYEVLNGDPWLAPGEDNERLAAQDREQRRAAARAAASSSSGKPAQQRQQMANQRRGVAARPGMPMGDGGRHDGDGGGIRPAAAPPAFPAAGPVAPRSRSTGSSAASASRSSQAAWPLAAGKNNDVRMLADVDVIAHDDTVEPGKTYRYKVRYKLLQPDLQAAARRAAGAVRPVRASSPPTAPGRKPVTMRPKVEFFLAGISTDSGKFDVFEWEKGQMKKNTIQAAAGDAIGETGWSMVDVRGTRPQGVRHDHGRNGPDRPPRPGKGQGQRPLPGPARRGRDRRQPAGRAEPVEPHGGVQVRHAAISEAPGRDASRGFAVFRSSGASCVAPSIALRSAS